MKCDTSGGARNTVDCEALNLVAGHAITGYSFLSIKFARDQKPPKTAQSKGRPVCVTRSVQYISRSVQYISRNLTELKYFTIKNSK